MGSGYGLNKLLSARFIRLKPHLCPFCEHFREHKDWYGVCVLRQKLLSNPHSERGTCTDYSKAGEPKLDQATIDQFMREGKEHREWNQRRDKRTLEKKIIDALKESKR